MKATYIATFATMRGSYNTVLQHILTISRDFISQLGESELEILALGYRDSQLIEVSVFEFVSL